MFVETRYCVNIQDIQLLHSTFEFRDWVIEGNIYINYTKIYTKITQFVQVAPNWEI